MVRVTLHELFEELQVPRTGAVYVQSSTDWLSKAGFGAQETLTSLREWMQAGTLVMPAYPFRVTHVEYLQSRPTYDVVRTPAAIGLLPEVFRRTPGVRRSLDPDFCIAALGADADDIVATDPKDDDPFGATSVYARLIERDATMLGLGVSLNTNSFIHVIDSRLSNQYPSPAYGDCLPVNVVNDREVSTTVWRRALAPEFQRLTQPSRVVEESGPDRRMFAARTVEGANFFRWNLARWSAWCDAHGRAAVAAGRWPCWLSRLSGSVA